MVDPFEERVEKINPAVSSLFNVWVMISIWKSKVEEFVQGKYQHLFYLHYHLSVYTVLFNYKHLAFYYVIFILYEYIILLIYFVTFILVLFCYAFTTPFLNKVFLELYAIDCAFYATTSSVYQITISFSKVKQKQFFSLLNM